MGKSVTDSGYTYAVIQISNDRTPGSKKINEMALIRTITVSATAFERTKKKFCGFRQTVALFTRYRITYVSDPFSYRIGVLFIRLWMNPIRSAPTVRYNSSPHEQVVRIRYETLTNLALV